ncbi:MAG: tape measure protein [Sinobacteraceae bacterium]|nr:tape measure protein [Nevskiaceae bacterium]
MADNLDVALRIRAAVSDALDAIRSVGQELQRLAVSGAQAAGGAQSAAAGISETDNAASATLVRVRDLAYGLGTLFVAMEAKRGVEALVEANIQLQQMQFSLLAATGSMQGAAQQMEFLTSVSKALGINLRESGLQFAQMLAAAQGQDIPVQTIQAMYLGLAETFDVLHASTYQQERVMQAFSEMLSMGTVHAQQFRLMLSRDLPGVPFTQLAAKELGITTEKFNELLNAGQITATQLFPALAKGLQEWAQQGDALNESMDGTNASLNRLKNAVFEATAQLSTQMSPALSAVADQLGKVIEAYIPLDTSIQHSSEKFSGLREAVVAVGETFAILATIVKTVWNGIVLLLDVIVDLMQWLNGLANLVGGPIYQVFVSLADAMSGNFRQAYRDLQQGGQEVVRGWQEMGQAGSALVNDLKAQYDKSVDDWATMWLKMDAIGKTASENLTLPTVAPAAPGEHAPTTADQKAALEAERTKLEAARQGSAERVAIARQEVEMAKAAFGEQSKEYQQALRDMNAALKERQDLERKVALAGVEGEEQAAVERLAIQRDAIERQHSLGLISDAEELQALRALEEQKYAIEVKALQDKLALEAETPEQYRRTQAQIEQLALKHVQTMQDIEARLATASPRSKLQQVDLDAEREAALQRLAIQRDAIEQQHSLGAMSDEEQIDALRALEEQKYQIELKALQDKLALEANDPVAYRQTQAQIEQLALQHAQAMQDIQAKAAEQTKQHWLEIFGVVTNAVRGSVQGLIQGTTTVANALRNIFQSILASLIDTLVQMAAQWAATHIAMAQVSAATENEVIAIKAAGALKGLAIKAATGIKEVAIDAYRAMAGAFAAIAAIPYVGPFLAPAAAAAAGAAVFEIGSKIASAEGGYDIPPGVNPITQLHAQEMVLPREYADVIRGMAGRGAQAPMQVTIHALDSESLERYLRRNPMALSRALRSVSRTGAFA